MTNSTVIIEILKHMPGRHNQDLHAGKRGKGSHAKRAHAGRMSDFISAGMLDNESYGMTASPFPSKHPNLMKIKHFTPEGVKEMMDRSETMIAAAGMDEETKKETLEVTRKALENANFYPPRKEVQAVVDSAKKLVQAGGVQIGDVDVFEDNNSFVGQLGQAAAFTDAISPGGAKDGMVILGLQVNQAAGKAISEHIVAHELVHASDRPNKMKNMNQQNVAALEEPITELLTIKALKKAGNRAAASAGIGEVYQTNIALLARALKSAGVEPGKESSYLSDLHQNGYSTPLGERLISEIVDNTGAMSNKFLDIDTDNEAALEKVIGEHVSKREYYQLVDSIVNKALPMELDVTYALFVWYLNGKINESRNLAAKLGKTAELNHLISEMRLNFIRCNV